MGARAADRAAETLVSGARPADRAADLVSGARP